MTLDSGAILRINDVVRMHKITDIRTRKLLINTAAAQLLWLILLCALNYFLHFATRRAACM